jgi:hypothetical protein
MAAREGGPTNQLATTATTCVRVRVRAGLGLRVPVGDHRHHVLLAQLELGGALPQHLLRVRVRVRARARVRVRARARVRVDRAAAAPA